MSDWFPGGAEWDECNFELAPVQEGAESLKRAQQAKHDATVNTEEARRRLRIQQEDEEDNKYRRRITK